MRLSVEETLRNLKQVEEKYKIRFTPTGEVNISEMARDCIDTIEALQAENEQLQAQVAKMREALLFTKEKIYEQLSNYVNDPKKFKYSAISIECVQKIVRALADASDYHNLPMWKHCGRRAQGIKQLGLNAPAVEAYVIPLPPSLK